MNQQTATLRQAQSKPLPAVLLIYYTKKMVISQIQVQVQKLIQNKKGNPIKELPNIVYPFAIDAVSGFMYAMPICEKSTGQTFSPTDQNRF